MNQVLNQVTNNDVPVASQILSLENNARNVPHPGAHSAAPPDSLQALKPRQSCTGKQGSDPGTHLDKIRFILSNYWSRSQLSGSKERKGKSIGCWSETNDDLCLTLEVLKLGWLGTVPCACSLGTASAARSLQLLELLLTVISFVAQILLFGQVLAQLLLWREEAKAQPPFRGHLASISVCNKL